MDSVKFGLVMSGHKKKENIRPSIKTGSKSLDCLKVDDDSTSRLESRKQPDNSQQLKHPLIENFVGELEMD
jgi:hypothetical protein